MVCRKVFLHVMMLRIYCTMHPGNDVLERDVDVVLEGDLITTEPLGVDDDLKDVDVCECAGWMAVIAVLGRT